MNSNENQFTKVALNYLNVLDQIQLSSFEFDSNIRSVNGLLIFSYPTMKDLDDNICAKLLEKYFTKDQINLSFTQLRNFLNLLGFYLLKFSRNGFFSPSTLQFISEPLQNPELKKTIIESREKIIKYLIEFAKRTVTGSVKIARQSQQLAFRKLNNDQLQEEIQKHMDNLLINFQNCNYLIVLFSESDADINLVYLDKNVLNNEVVSLFKSQDIAKLNTQTEAQLLRYIQDSNDTNLFDDYRKMSHEDLLKKIKNILQSNSKPGFAFQEENFEENSQVRSLVQKLNRTLAIIANKLESYVLSADNFVKMILIYNKIKSDLPVVIVGETGCGKTSLIAYLAINILHVKFMIFNIHAGVNQNIFLNQINHYFAIANHLNEEIWLFFDEFNTSDAMFLITEMICQKTILGSPVPANIKFLAACNPYKVKSKKIEVGLVMQRETTKLVHNVHPLPESLIEHIWDYGSLCEEDEKSYIGTMIRSLKLANHDLIKEMIFESHKYIREIEEVSSVSLRDVDRFRKLYDWFDKVIQSRRKMGQYKDNNFRNQFQNYQIENNRFYNAILSLYICYLIRLSKEEFRNNYLKKLSFLFRNHGFQISYDDVLKVIETEQEQYLDRMILQKSKGIAKNNALRENVFATFVSIMNNIPIFICGKPGCSKTLSIQLISSSLRGQNSIDDWFKILPGLFTVNYQGSESSTSEGNINF